MPLIVTVPIQITAPGIVTPWSTPGAVAPTNQSSDVANIYFDDNTLGSIKSALGLSGTSSTPPDYSASGIAANADIATIESALQMRIKAGGS